MRNTMFMMNYGSNEGYAMKSMERMFFRTGLTLAKGDRDRLHFCYTSLDNGRPDTLPNAFENLISEDWVSKNTTLSRKFIQYVKDNSIEIIVAFDLSPADPLISTLRGAGVDTVVAYWGAPVSSLMPLWKLTVKKLLYRFSKCKVDGLIFESKELARFATHGRGIPERDVFVVPLGVDISTYKAKKTAYTHRSLGIPDRKKIIVSAGHVYEGKGIGVLIDAAIILLKHRNRDDVCFLICGDRPGESDPYKSKFANMNLEDSIIFGGYRSDMSDIYQGCYAGVVPTIIPESYAFSAVEMAASGLPVIASRIGGLKESIVHLQTGILCNPNDALDLADTIERLVNCPDEASRLGKAGRIRCETELNTSAHERRLVSALTAISEKIN